MNKKLKPFNNITKVKRLPLRDEITKEIFDYFISTQALTYNQARCKCAITLLKISGLRVNEIRTLTWKDIRLAREK